MENVNHLSEIKSDKFSIQRVDLGVVKVEAQHQGKISVGSMPELLSYEDKCSYITSNAYITHVVIEGLEQGQTRQCTIVTLNSIHYVVCTTEYSNHTLDECPLVIVQGGGDSVLFDTISSIIFNGEGLKNMDIYKKGFDIRECEKNDNFGNITNSIISRAGEQGVPRVQCLAARTIAVEYVKGRLKQPNLESGV